MTCIKVCQNYRGNGKMVKNITINQLNPRCLIMPYLVYKLSFSNNFKLDKINPQTIPGKLSININKYQKISRVGGGVTGGNGTVQYIPPKQSLSVFKPEFRNYSPRVGIISMVDLNIFKPSKSSKPNQNPYSLKFYNNTII